VKCECEAKKRRKKRKEERKELGVEKNSTVGHLVVCTKKIS